MKTPLLACVLGLTASLLFAAGPARAASATPPAPVTITENDATYTLDNGIVSAMVAKASGDLVSLKYKGLEILATRMDANGQPDLAIDPPGENLRGLNATMTDHQYGFWSHDAMGVRDTVPAVAKVTIDPKSNGGKRAEVSIKGVSNGRKMGTGPGANTNSTGDGDFIADIELRYTLDAGESGVYTYCVFEHLPTYPATTITEARFAFKANDFFDWMLADETPHRNKLYPKESRENKYSYTTVQFDNPAYGWGSTTKNVAVFILNPSMEYMSGGPTKVEFLTHRDTNAVAAPTTLNYWRSSHYGGAGVTVADGEHWAKVIGPFMIYVNSGTDLQALRNDAIAQQSKESAKWPYSWVAGIDYPLKDQRGTVTGQLVLNDPFVPNPKMSRPLIGLVPPQTTTSSNGPTTGRGLFWQNDAKHYQFWARASDDGKFTIPNVRPGTYELRAMADGVLGEYSKAEITVEAGKTIDLSKLNWTPLHYGKQVWEIGIPNRSPKEFFKGDDWWHDNMDIQYAQAFPNDVNYVVGKSDYTKDWFYEHVPHASDEAVAASVARGAAPRGSLPGETAPGAPRGAPRGTAAAGPATPAANGTVAGGPAPATRGPARGAPAAGPGRASPWSISWDMPQAGKGTAVLRIALARTAITNIGVSLNGEPVGQFANLISDGGLSGTGLGIQGTWREYALSIDAAKFKQGTNTITLTVPAGATPNGVDYDYVRLEVNENAPFAFAQQ